MIVQPRLRSDCCCQFINNRGVVDVTLVYLSFTLTYLVEFVLVLMVTYCTYIHESTFNLFMDIHMTHLQNCIWKNSKSFLCFHLCFCFHCCVCCYICTALYATSVPLTVEKQYIRSPAHTILCCKY